MRQKKFYLALMIFLPIGLFSQTKEIKLQIKSLGVSKAELFVVSVIDSRDNTSKIGTSHYYNSKSKINSKLESAPIYTGNIILHKEYKEESPKPKQKKGGSYAIGITPSIGVSSLGGSLTFYNFNNKNDSASVIFPTVINLDILLITPYFANQLGIRSGSYNYFKLGVNPLFRINKNAYLSCLAQFVFGLDSYKSYSNTTTNLAIGGYFSQGIYRMPKKGFYIGFGIYEFFSSSKIYPIDLGLKLEMGFRF